MSEAKSKVVQFSDLNTAGVNNVLIPVNTILDTDFGLACLIYREYFDSRVFSVEFHNTHKSVKSLVSALYDREKENPLYCIANSDAEDLDKMYYDFIKTKYKDILKYSMTTAVYNAIEIFKKVGGVTVTIACENDLEIKALETLKTTKDISKIKLEDVDTENISQFFFKSIDDIYMKLLSKHIKSKTIYIADYKFNMDSKTFGGNEVIATNQYTALLSLNRSTFGKYDIYDRTKLSS